MSNRVVLTPTLQYLLDRGDLIIHSDIRVNRNRSPQEVIFGISREKPYLDDDVVASIPRGQGDMVDLYYVNARDHFSSFKEGNWTRPNWISCDNLDKWLQKLGLITDPYAQFADNEADPAFADKYKNIAFWKNNKDKWCHSSFGCWLRNDRSVVVNTIGNGCLLDDDWFACRGR